MVRKLAAAMLGVGVLIPGLANALGLGEIKLNSALSEPLDAEIELVQVRELTSNEILPELASQDDFASSNVERFHFLTDLKFEVIVNQQGKSVIKIRSRKPVKEPFLNFLVEVNWPAGRLLREYTLLLDPPIYSAQKAEPVSAPTTASPTTTSVQPVTTTYQSDKPQSTYSSGEYAQGAQLDSHTIGSNDSLWTIAKNMKPSDRVSIQQTMMAIQRKNPDAFIDNNINLLKRGAVLRAPSEEEVMQLSSRDAIAMAAEQNRQWKQRASGGSTETEARQIDLSGRSVDREQDPASAPAPDRLKLVSAGTDTGDSGQGGSGSSGQLRDKLMVAEENVDKFKLENEELRFRMSDLEDQLDTSEKVLTLKDEQIAALQAKLRELEAAEQAESQTLSESGEVVSEPVMAGDLITDESDQEPMAEDADAVATGELIAPEETTDEEVDYNFAEDTSAGEEEMASDEEMAIGDTDDAVATTPQDMSGVGVDDPSQSEPQPPEPPVQPQPQDLLSQILANPMYLAAGGGAILLLIVLGLVAARRKQSGSELDDDIPEEFDLPEAQGSDELMELDSVDLEEDDAFEEAVEASAEEETVPQTSDVIGEADIYIAYGRFPQAIEMLEKAAEGEPDRADIRLKLCEVCAEANEPEIFMNHYRVLQDVGTSADVSKADDLRGKFSDVPAESDDSASDLDGDETILADSAAENFDFDNLDSAESEATDSLESELEQESDTGLDFDLGDLEDTGTSFTSDQAESESTPGQDSQTSAEVAGLDFDLNLDLDEDESPAKSDDESSSMDFDLDTAFDSDTTSEAPSESKEDSDEVSLDFDTDFSLDEVPDSGTAEPSDDSSNDLSMDFETSQPIEPTTPTDESSDSSDMDFDLDFDSSTTELDETPSLDFSDTEVNPEAPATSAAEEEQELDSQSAAQLADELDLDLDADFLDTPASDEPELDVPAATDEDQTIIADMTPPAPPSAPAANDMSDSGEELDFLSDADEASTKLDLARAYIDMGDRDGAKDILDEVMIEGNDTQKTEAKDLLTRLES